MGSKNEQRADTCYNMCEPWKHAKWKKTVTKGHILYDAVYMILQENTSPFVVVSKRPKCFGINLTREL